MTISLLDARCRVNQAESVLTLWLEGTTDNHEANMVASIITILDGIDKAIEEAENKLAKIK